jgi:hypothetical protein
MAAIDDLLKIILDTGKRSFSIEDVPGNDPDTFYSEYVVPLRQLRARGVIENLAEARMNTRGESHVARVDIVGGINFNQEEENGE